MTPLRKPDRLISAFLAEGPDELPDRAYDAVRAHIDRTRQRVVIGPWREPRMSAFARVAIAAAAVLVVGVIGFNLLGGPRQITGSGATASPNPPPTAAPSPTAAASPIVLPVGSLAAGVPYVVDRPCCQVAPITFSVPRSGWFELDGSGIFGRNEAGRPSEGDFFDVAVSIWRVGNVYTDVCAWQDSAAEPPIGPGVDDLAEALVEHAGTGAAAVSDVTLAGYAGKRVELTVPSDTNVATCDDGKIARWASPNDATGGYPHTYGPDQHDTVYILDVEGERQVIDTMYLPSSSTADRAELQSVLDTFRIQP